MISTVRQAALRGLEDRKRGVVRRLRNAADATRSASAGEAGVLAEFAGWLAARLDAGADAIDVRRADAVLSELKDLASRHPAATATVAATLAFVGARLLMPQSAPRGPANLWRSVRP